MFTFPVTLFSGGATRTFIGGSTDGAGTNHTFTSAALGSPVGTSCVAVLVELVGLGVAITISSITIAGVSATIHTSQQGIYAVGNRTARCAVASAIVAASSGNIVVNMSAANSGCAIGVYRLNNLVSVTPTASGGANTGTAPSSDPSMFIDIPTNGILLFGMSECDAGPVSVSGVTNDIIQAYGVANIGNTWDGSNDGLAAETGRALTTNTGGTTVAAIVGAAWN